MIRSVSFEVFGIAQQKGSTRAFVPKGWTRAIVTAANSKGKGWEQLVAAQAQAVAGEGLFLGPVRLDVAFHLPRPKSLPRRVVHNVKMPDLDKLIRCLGDALTGVLYVDDAQVVEVHALKLYAGVGSTPRARVTVADAAPPDPVVGNLLAVCEQEVGFAHPDPSSHDSLE